MTPESAEFWEGAGAVVTAVKLVAAIASGERINIGENEKVGFPQGGKARGLKLEFRGELPLLMSIEYLPSTD